MAPDTAHLWHLWLIALMFAAALMAGVWLTAVRIHNAGIVDIAWSAGFAPIAIYFACVGDGDPARRILLAALVSFWSVRLGGHLYVRVMGHHPTEDRRYAELRRGWGAAANRNFFWFFEMQALLLAILSLPALKVCLNPARSLQPLEIGGAVLFVVALGGESMADRQLARFRADAANRGEVCEVGLWRYSRHPNYFFEWLIWVALFAMACAAPLGWITIYCPALMLYFLLRVTGIPMTERLSLESKGAAFADYQRRVSVFVPWFPKRS
jgi:steroid 5-alpha reductase family enzyme